MSPLLFLMICIGMVEITKIEFWKKDQNWDDFFSVVVVLFTGPGLFSLLLSIFYPNAWIKKNAITSILILVGLLFGTFIASGFLMERVSQYTSMRLYFYSAVNDLWIFVLPIVVAVWNSVRIIKWPNKSLHPTVNRPRLH